MSAAVDDLDQLRDLIGKAEEQRQSLSHVAPARAPVTFLRHRGFPFLPVPAGGSRAGAGAATRPRRGLHVARLSGFQWSDMALLRH